MSEEKRQIVWQKFNDPNADHDWFKTPTGRFVREVTKDLSHIEYKDPFEITQRSLTKEKH